MHTLGVSYSSGLAGLVKDRTQARAWFERAAELGHPKGMARLGQSLLKGHGGPSNPALGLVYATRAAEAGSDLAAFQLGKAFVKGKHGLSQNSALAKHYLRKIVEGECTLKHLIEKCHTEAKELLEQLN